MGGIWAHLDEILDLIFVSAGRNTVRVEGGIHLQFLL